MVVVRTMFYGFDYRPAFGPSGERHSKQSTTRKRKARGIRA